MVVFVCGVLSQHADYLLHTHICSGVTSGSFVLCGVLYQYLPSHAASGRLNVVNIATAVVIAAVVIAVVVVLVVCTMALVALLGV